MPNTVLEWLLTILLIIVVTICVIVAIHALGDEGAFDFIAWRARL